MRLPIRPWNSASRFACVIALIVPLVIAHVAQAFSEEPSKSQNQFAEAVEAWKAARGTMFPITASATTLLEGEFTDPKNKDLGKKNVTKSLTKFWFTDRSTKVVTDIFDESGKWKRRRVFGSNTDYGFMAQQDIENGPYFVTECVRGGNEMDHVAGALRLYKGYLLPSIGVDADVDALPDIVGRESFKLLGTREVEIGKHSYTEFQVSFVPNEIVAHDDKTPVHCAILVDPDADWRVVHTSSEKAGRSATMDVTYGDGQSIDGVKKVEWKRTYPNARNSEVMKVTSISHEAPPDSNFYLSSLGLPDCPASGLTWNRLLLFIAFDLLVLGAIFLFLYRCKRGALRPAPVK